MGRRIVLELLGLKVTNISTDISFQKGFALKAYDELQLEALIMNKQPVGGCTDEKWLIIFVANVLSIQQAFHLGKNCLPMRQRERDITKLRNYLSKFQDSESVLSTRSFKPSLQNDEIAENDALTALWPVAAEYPTRKRKVKEEPEFLPTFEPEVIVKDPMQQQQQDQQPFDDDNDHNQVKIFNG